ncbi:hypothetical protein QS306_14605 [Paraburkholderia bonniea]|uniref:hypothetical protein n=1 Tax=Paraburkholderia bonniea TaxID=2152891 RepID=UPI001290C028|nr:hypothetical protein [Paraburkholderia bonniea]WJF91997.1 hypothetical protein QS306_14605 [Paraburkholderia bonniea]WJF95316.1 hypothetical protein QS308_14610 [Paraburkholderia bonniea]
MNRITATAKTGFMHGRYYRKGDTVYGTPEVISDLEKAGLVGKDCVEDRAKKAALVPGNRKAPEPENRSRK